MSQENVELFYRAHDAFNRRDIDAFLAFADPDIEFTPLTLRLEGGDLYRGHEGARSWLENLLGFAPDFSTEIDEVRDLGDATVARLRLLGHGVASEAPMEQAAWQVAKWCDNKVIWWGTYLSEAEALEAVGVRE